MNRIINFLSFSYRFGRNLSGSNFWLQILISLKAAICVFWWKFIEPREFVFNLKFRDKNMVFHCDNRMDLAVLDEIFIKGEYQFDYDISPKIILDLGANIGDTAIFYSIFFPNAQIFAVEPNPFIFKKLKKNTNLFSNIHLAQCAISDKNGKINLNIGESHLGSSILHRDQNNKSVEVDTFTISNFCENHAINEIDILKFDIEGAEESLLRENFVKSKVKIIVGEIHKDLILKEIEKTIDNLLLKNKIIKTISKNKYIIFGNL